MAISVWDKDVNVKIWDKKVSSIYNQNKIDYSEWVSASYDVDYSWQDFVIEKASWDVEIKVRWAQWWNSNWWKWWFSKWKIRVSNKNLIVRVWWRWGQWMWWFNWWWIWSDRWWFWWGWATDVRIWWDTLNHRRIVAWWWWGWDTGWVWNWWWVWWWLTWWSVSSWRSSSSNGLWWSQTSWWWHQNNGWNATDWTFWTWWHWIGWSWSSFAETWWWGWWYWWGGGVANGAWGWSWYVYTQSTEASVPSSYDKNSDYYLKEASTKWWWETFESVDWWTETGHTWNWYAKIEITWWHESINPTYITSPGAYHNPDLWLISISTDWENWITISDKNVWATVADPEDTDSYWDIFQYWNIHHFAWDWSWWTVTVRNEVPDLTGYEGGNLYSDDKYRTNIDWNAANKNLWKPIAFQNLLSLQKGPCDKWFHVPSAEEWTAMMNAILELEWEEAEFSYDLISRYLLIAHPNSRKWDGVFYSSNTSIYFTNSYIANQNKINAFVMIWDEWSESGWLSATDMNCGWYIRWFRDVAMVPTSEWEQIGGGSTVRLPLEYQEVAYIETTWTQYIDTWLYPSNNIQVETIVEVTTTDQNIPIFWSFMWWSWTDWLWTYYHVTPYNSKFYYWLNWSEWNAWSYSATAGTQYTIVFNNSNSKLVVNGSEIATTTWTAWYTWTTLWISRRWQWGSARYWKFKYFYFRMYDKNTNKYVRDYVPCYRRIDWVIWMYDLVNDVFYTNQWSWNFSKWIDVNVPELPQQYQEVEYLESSAEQYINTGFIPSVNTEIRTNISWWWTQAYWAVFYWVTSSDSAPDWILWRLYYASDKWAVTTFNRWFCNSDYAQCQQTTSSVNVFHDIYSKKNYSRLDSSTPTITTTWTPYQSAIYMFCWNNWWTAWRHSSCKIKTFLIADWWIIQRFLIPCYRKSDNKPGYFDLKNKVFYVNSWSWEFTMWYPILYKVNQNTVAYYKFNWNINDDSWNWRDFSMKWWSFSYWTIGNIKYLNFPESAWTNWISSFPFNSVSYTRCFWMKFPNYSKTWSWYYWIVLDFWRGSSMANSWVSRIENKNWYFTCDTINFTPPDYDKRYMYTLVDINWETKLYVNWEYIWTWTWWINTSVTDVTLALNNAPDTNAAQYAWRWQMALLICEKWQWSEDYIKEYYNKSKSIFE